MLQQSACPSHIRLLRKRKKEDEEPSPLQYQSGTGNDLINHRLFHPEPEDGCSAGKCGKSRGEGETSGTREKRQPRGLLCRKGLFFKTLKGWSGDFYLS